MQCTGYIPVYYHARDLNIGSSGFSWHLIDKNDNGEQRGYNMSMPLCNTEQYLGYDKERLKQIIQNHEATFRYQVQELHRLYRRQRELMDEMRMREIFAQHLLSQTSESIHCLSRARSEFPQTPSHSNSWLLGDLSSSKLSELTAENIQRLPNFVAESSTARLDSFIRNNSYSNDVKFPSSSSKGNENRFVDLEFQANMCHDEQVKQFKGGIFFDARESAHEVLEKLTNFWPDIDSVKTGDSFSFNTNTRKTNCYIDLNEPVQLESQPSCSSGTSPHMETMSIDDPCVSVVPEHSGLVNCDGSSSDGINLSMTIDLNSVPVGCFSEAEVTLENLNSMNKETCTDLNTTGIVDDEYSPPLSSSILQIKSAEDTELEGPVSPENEECSPPRGKSEETTPLLLEKGVGEPSLEFDDTIAAAETLVMMLSSSGVQEYVEDAMVDPPLVNLRDCLCWFAEIVSSTGDDDLDDMYMHLQNDASDNDQGELLNSSHVNKEKGKGTLSSRSRKGTNECKGFQTEVRRSLNSCSKDLYTVKGFLETSRLRKKGGRKRPCAKRRKYSKLAPSDVVNKKSAHSKRVVLQSWGKIRKRQGGRRRRASEFLLIS